MRVTILGPNLPGRLSDKGTLHVHAEGCADIKRNYSFRGVIEDAWTIDADSVLGAVADIYPPGDFQYDIQDPEDRVGYVNDIFFAPCVKNLPLGEEPMGKRSISPGPLDGYTTSPTHARLYYDEDDRNWHVDGADYQGRVTEELWIFDTVEEAAPFVVRFYRRFVSGDCPEAGR